MAWLRPGAHPQYTALGRVLPVTRGLKGILCWWCHSVVLGVLALSPLPFVLSESWVKSRGAGGGQLISSHVVLTQPPQNACKWIPCVFKKSAIQIKGGKRGGKKKKKKIKYPTAVMWVFPVGEKAAFCHRLNVYKPNSITF